ncbi:MAG TPA: xanthine dehydrogenase family protein molybdopterin-binding subunit [Thermomicrobiales bacterium]|nr:xanthine dehydrogenase family protein molybdopterin-binding subunit [Thermomicrobiales bacterium]
MPAIQIEKKLEAGEDGQPQYEIIEENTVPAWGADANLTTVGQPLSRVEGVEKVTGRAVYTYDVRLPGQLYARVLRSPHPHAHVKRVDTSRAETMPGVRAVLCVANAPDIDWYKEGKLFERTVRFAGDEVAVVAAESEEQADDALRAIEVEYEPLPFVVDLKAASRPDAPQLHPDAQDNVSGDQTYERGDPDAGFSEAEVVIEVTYDTQTNLHNCLEPHGTTASWDGYQLTLWSSTQSVFEVRSQVAQKLGLPEHHVRVIKQHMGGGFGSKQVPWKQDVIAALLSKQARRPVQLMLDREAENLAAGNRNATVQKVRIGAKRDGTLTAIEADIELETGAYQVGGEASDVKGIYETLYRCPNVRTKQVGRYTNVGPTVAFRAPGYVEGAWGLEQAMDELARELQLDPIELRLRNYSDTDQVKEQQYTIPETLRLCHERAAEVFGWHDWQRPEANGTKRRGIGVAAHNWMGGAGAPPGYAWVKLNSDGSADVVTGTQDIGSGTRTGLTQVAAEELGLPAEQVNLQLGDTANGPYAPVSAGSKTQATIGPAIRVAAAAAKRDLLHAASQFLEEPVERLYVRAGQIHVDGEANPVASVADITGRLAPHMIFGQGARGPNPPDKAIRTFGVQIAEVEVDTATGEVTVLRLVSADDCGRVINPTMVRSQVIGGVTQGLGVALTEERIIDQRLGIVLNANLEEYKVPTVADIPAITSSPIDVPDPQANETGAKGIGESPIVPTAPAIANAIIDAVGVRIRQAPVIRERLLDALATRDGGNR